MALSLSGVFIRSSRNDGEFRNECLKKLDSLSADRNIRYINRDDTYGGFKVYFKDPATVSNILKEKKLFIGQEWVPVYPLATNLVVHAGPLDFTDEFEHILRQAVSQLGSVLEVKKIPFCESFPDIYTGEWKIVLEVPEIEDLEIFTRNGFPGDMVLKLPDVSEEYRMTFYCSSCSKEGHTLQRCPKNKNDLSSDTETQSRQIDSLSSSKINEPDRMSPVAFKAASAFRIRDLNEERTSLDLQEKMLPNISSKNIASIASRIGEEAVRQQLMNSRNEKHLYIKQERNAGLKEKISRKRPANDTEGGSTEGPKAKKGFTAPISRSKEFFSDEDSQNQSFSKPGCSNFDGNVIILEENVSSRPNSISSSNSMNTARSNSVDESGQVTTSSLSEGMCEPIKSELPSTDENDSDSEPQTPRPVQRRRKPTQFRQINIPEGIKDIIQKNQTVLDTHQLEAFFNHVKKKACPSEVAKQYTTDLSGLKEQLQRIKDQYYYSPIIHNPAEKNFMKWYVSVLDRYDRKPAKRVKKIKE